MDKCMKQSKKMLLNPKNKQEGKAYHKEKIKSNCVFSERNIAYV